jgi:hypothetical protein
VAVWVVNLTVITVAMKEERRDMKLIKDAIMGSRRILKDVPFMMVA